MIRFLPFCCFFLSLQSFAQPAPNNFLAGRTTGLLPYLEYGLGDDRLGGAKMTYLDTLVAVKVIDSTTDDYKIRLSERHVAWMPKTNFRLDSSLVIRPYYLTDSWKVYGDDKYDYVTVMLDERLPYRSLQLITPSRIVVDIFGATCNTNWITQLSSSKEVKNAYYEQIEDDVFRVVIELKHPTHWGYSIYYQDTRLIIRVNRQPASLSLNKLKIAVDAGHGGDNLGASGARTHILEKNYTLRFAKELEKALKKERASVFMTRRKDTSLSMVDRTLMLREAAPDVLISIHLNSGDRGKKGTSTYYRYIGFRPLTQYVLHRMLQPGLAEFGNIGSFNFGLSGPTDYPNCLVEVAFLSDRGDEKKIRSPQFQKAVATKIVQGIKDWLRSIES